MDEQHALLSEDLQQRTVAAEALSMMGPDAAHASVDLVKACADEEVVRDLAIATLEELGPPLPAALAELSALVSSSNAMVAYWAITLLGRSGKSAQSSQHDLVDVLNSSEDKSVKERAVWALGKIEANTDAAVHALKQAAGSGDERLARLANASLEQIAK